MPHVPCIVENNQWRKPFPKEVFDKWQSAVATLDDFVSCLSVHLCSRAQHSSRNREKKKKGLGENWPHCWHLAYLLEPQGLGPTSRQSFAICLFLWVSAFRENSMCLTSFESAVVVQNGKNDHASRSCAKQS